MLQQHKIRFTVFSFKNMHTHTHTYIHIRYILSTALITTRTTTTAATKRRIRRRYWLNHSEHDVHIIRCLFKQHSLAHSQSAYIYDMSRVHKRMATPNPHALYITIDFTWARACARSRLFLVVWRRKKCSRDLMDMSLCDYHWFNWQIKLAEYFSTDGFHWKCERSRAPRETLRSI